LNWEVLSVVPFYQDLFATIYHGDRLDVLRSIPDCSVDSVVTDPPYGLAFMGKRWDYDVPPVEVWQECLRVLKPGGHLLSFAGTRTQHRMAVRIEDAGFEIRDMIAWVYGSGFPKSLDVSKAIDKAAGAEREVVGAGKGRTGQAAQPNGGSIHSDDNYQWPGDFNITAPATPEARQWAGWGTALKPALEPITVARKPLIGTVAENVLTHGTGAINVDDCRVGTDDLITNHSRSAESSKSKGKYGDSSEQGTHQKPGQLLGRWPANLIHDSSDEVLVCFPNTKSGKPGVRRKEHETAAMAGRPGVTGEQEVGYGDAGSAARFFYCAKASKKDRGDGNNHPTVKPTELMRYLCRLVTPPGGVVVDPHMGSGSTALGAMLEGFRFIGVDNELPYCEIAAKRISKLT